MPPLASRRSGTSVPGALAASWEIIGAAAFLSLLNYALRIHRWRGYLSRLGHTLSFGYTVPTYIAGFAYTLSPGKMGEMMRARYYLPKGVPLSDVTAAFFAERLLDVISMLFLASFLLTALSRFAGVPGGGDSCRSRRTRGHRAASLAIHKDPTGWRGSDRRATAQDSGRLASAFASTKPLLGPGLLVSGFLTGLLAWGLEGAGLGLLTSIYPLQDLSILTAVGIYGIAVLVGGFIFPSGWPRQHRGRHDRPAGKPRLPAGPGPRADTRVSTRYPVACGLHRVDCGILVASPAQRRGGVTMAVSVEATRPLCVDLDGTLINSDVLLESLLLLLKNNPLYLFLIPVWLMRGKAALKAQVAARVNVDPAALPYNKRLLEWLRAERQAGRSLWLCTAANERPARTIAEHLGLFDGVLASDASTNLSGSAKADQLVGKFGAGGFDYCGNEPRDLAVWRRAGVPSW